MYLPRETVEWLTEAGKSQKAAAAAVSKVCRPTIYVRSRAKVITGFFVGKAAGGTRNEGEEITTRCQTQGIPFASERRTEVRFSLGE